MENEPSLRHLASYTAVTLSPFSGLECGEQLWGVTGEGGTQGDPRTTDDFTITLQPSLVMLDKACEMGGGLARAGADDVLAMGPSKIVIPAVTAFAEEVKDRCGLEAQWDKTEVYTLASTLPEGSPVGLTMAGRVIGYRFVKSFNCW